jgi:DNA-binding transcriptional regulator YhcF (GntR family)
VIETSGFAPVIDRDADVPLGLQLDWALSAYIQDGGLEPGQRLPGLRELAEASGLNVNTVRAVYQRLEHRGLLETQQGSGTFVASTLGRPSTVGEIAADAAREARATGVDPREVAAALYVAPEPSAPPADQAAERRRQLRTQIAALERMLGELEAGHPGLAPVTGPQARRLAGPALLSLADLEQVRTTLVRRLADLQTAIDALGERPADRGSSAAATTATARKTATAPKPAARSRSGTRPAPVGA